MDIMMHMNDSLILVRCELSGDHQQAVSRWALNDFDETTEILLELGLIN